MAPVTTADSDRAAKPRVVRRPSQRTLWIGLALLATALLTAAALVTAGG